MNQDVVGSNTAGKIAYDPKIQPPYSFKRSLQDRQSASRMARATRRRIVNYLTFAVGLLPLPAVETHLLTTCIREANNTH